MNSDREKLVVNIYVGKRSAGGRMPLLPARTATSTNYKLPCFITPNLSIPTRRVPLHLHPSTPPHPNHLTSSSRFSRCSMLGTSTSLRLHEVTRLPTLRSEKSGEIPVTSPRSTPRRKRSRRSSERFLSRFDLRRTQSCRRGCTPPEGLHSMASQQAPPQDREANDMKSKGREQMRNKE
jgi:hypothetical protein